MRAARSLSRAALAAGLPLLAVLANLGCGGGLESAGGTLTVPEGFEVEIAAEPPLVERPMIIDSDEQGRLYVAESSGSNAPVREQLEQRPHSILRLDDIDGDGRFDRRTVFADKMMFPEGVLWHDGSLYVAAPPVIWKLTDADGDGTADQREEWFNGQTLTNCANDLHGPYLGLDGWIYWTKGAFAEQTYERPGKKPLVTRAAHIFRRRPEGGPIEAVLTGGMDNPVEVAFAPTGERFLTATFLQHPELGRRDGLIHALYGGVYGKVHGVTDDHPQTGGLLSPMAHLGPAAPVGLAYYRSGAFGGEYEGDLFSTLFNLHKVLRHELTPDGATFTSEESDFLVSDSVDFHPTDVMEDADGSLLVVDTGGWYKLCCPTSQLAKPDVLGAIYRVRRSGASLGEDPRGLRLDWARLSSEDLVKLLEDRRPAIVSRAIATLAKMGAEALPALRETLQSAKSAAARRNAVWALTRIEEPDARLAVREALAGADDRVRHAAMHSIAVWRDKEALPQLRDQVRYAEPPLQRVAAEALGRLGSGTAVEALLAAAADAEDEVLRHSVTYALIEIGDRTATRRGLNSSSIGTRRAALIALDQMERGYLGPDAVLPLLSSNEEPLREAAAWVAGRHPEWGGRLAGFLRGRLRQAKLGDQERAELEKQLIRFSSDESVQALLAQTARSATPPEARLTALRVMAAAPVKEAPAAWNAALAALIPSAKGELLQQAVATARALPQPEEPAAQLHSALMKVGQSSAAPAEVRAEALAAAHPQSLEPPAFDFLLASLAPAKPVRQRAAAARALAEAALTPEQLLALADEMAEAGPLELPVLLRAFNAGGDQQLGSRLVAALQNADSRAAIRPDLLEAALEKFPQAVRQQGEELLASLDIDRAEQRAHLEELLASLGEGDVRRGQTVFNSEKSACRSCHRIGYLGGRVGPDLTRISEIRTERDLLEAVVYPSASFVRSFEPIVVVTGDDVHNGVPLEETDDHLLLATGAETQVRIPRDEVEEVRPGTVSVMPSGLEEQLSRQELADLIAFLKGTKWGPN